MKAQKVGRLLQKDVIDTFEKIDAILIPTAPSEAFAIDEQITDPLTMYLNDTFTVANVKAPGYVNTEMIAAMPKEPLDKIIERVPTGCLAEVHEIARAALYLEYILGLRSL